MVSIQLINITQIDPERIDHDMIKRMLKSKVFFPKESI